MLYNDSEALGDNCGPTQREQVLRPGAAIYGGVDPSSAELCLELSTTTPLFQVPNIMAASTLASLLHLPYELQTRIIDYAFGGAESKIEEAHGRPRQSGTHHSILLTCSYFYDTFVNAYYQQLTLRITHPYPNTSNWRNSPFCNNIRRLSLAGCVPLHEKDASVLELLSDHPKPGSKTAIYFPNLTDVFVDGSSHALWDLPCHLYIKPDDEGAFAKLLRGWGGYSFRRPKGIPDNTRYWERHTQLIRWECTTEGDHPSVPGEVGGCRFKGVDAMDPRRYDYHQTIVICGEGNQPHQPH